MLKDTNSFHEFTSHQINLLLEIIKWFKENERIPYTKIAKDACVMSENDKSCIEEIGTFLHRRKIKSINQDRVVKPLFNYIKQKVKNNYTIDSEIYDKISMLPNLSVENLSNEYGPLMPIISNFLKTNKDDFSELEEKYYGEYFSYRHSSLNKKYVVSSLKISEYSETNSTAQFRSSSLDDFERPIKKSGVVYEHAGKIYFFGFADSTAILETMIINEHVGHPVNVLNGIFTGIDDSGRIISSRIALIRKDDTNIREREGVHDMERTRFNTEMYYRLVDNVIERKSVLKTPE